MIIISLSNFVIVYEQTKEILSNNEHHLSISDIEAINFLEKQEKGNVLSSKNIGNQIIWTTSHKTYVGLWNIVPNLNQKIENINNFFSEKIDLDWKINFLKENKIDYIYYSPIEKKLGSIDLQIPLDKIFEEGNVTIYKTK